MNKIFFPFLGAALVAAAALGADAPALTLRDAVSAALARSPGVEAAEWAREESAAETRLVRDAFHPQAWLSTTPGYARGLPVAVAGRVPAIAGVELRQTLYDPSLRAGSFDAGAADADRAGAAEAARLEIARATIVLYARCRADLAGRSAAASRVAALEEVSAHVDVRRGEGRETDLSGERASLALARARQRLLDAESETELDFRELRLSADLPPGSTPALPDDPGAALPSPADDRETIRAADPILRALARELELRQAAARARAHPAAPVVEAEAQYWRLSRANGYDRYYRQFKADDWSVGLAVTVPLFSGGRFAEERRRADSAVRRVEAQARARRDELDILLSRREAALDRALSAVALARRARGVARQAADEAAALRREGRGPADAAAERAADAAAERAADVSEAEEEVARAELALAQARGDALAASGELLPFFSRPPAPR